MTTLTPETARELLAPFEAELDVMTAQWRTDFIAARASRIKSYALASAIAEQGRGLAGKPEVARVCFEMAERLALACRAAEFAVRQSLAPVLIADFDDGAPRETAAAVDEWRRKLTAVMAPPDAA